MAKILIISSQIEETPLRDKVDPHIETKIQILIEVNKRTKCQKVILLIKCLKIKTIYQSQKINLFLK